MDSWVLTSDSTYWPGLTRLDLLYDPFNETITSMDVVCANHRDQELAEKALSGFLRHYGADSRFDVGMDTGGWVSVLDLLEFVRRGKPKAAGWGGICSGPNGNEFTASWLLTVFVRDTKGRFEIGLCGYSPPTGVEVVCDPRGAADSTPGIEQIERAYFYKIRACSGH